MHRQVWHEKSIEFSMSTFKQISSMKKQIFLAVIIMTVILTGCSSKKATTGGNQTNMEQATAVIGKKWQLIELYGKAIPATINGKMPFIEFFEADNRYSASAGCNGLGGSFTLENNGRIKFSQGMSTMMACQNMEVESEFKNVLEQADNYTISGNRLSLNKARMAPLARFQLVEENNVPDMHNSRISVDWNGHYRGTLPCADCEGIEIALNLNADNTFSMHRKYLGKETKATNTSGKFTWTDDGGKIVLSDNQILQVGENQLFWLDKEGNRITGELAPLYVLEKQEINAVKEKYWKLVSINDVPVTVLGNREAHIILKGDGQLKGHGGCNALFGTYIAGEQNNIGFQNIGSTKMMCEAIKTEDELIKVLLNTNSYFVKNDNLYLYKDGTAPLAHFEAVYF